MAWGTSIARVRAQIFARARSWGNVAWRGLRDTRTLREIAPLAIVLVMAPWLKQALTNYLASALFRDVDMFTYASWCVLHGDRLYDQIATPDGPLVYLIYGALNVFARSTSDQAFLLADVVFQFVLAATMGALLVPANTELKWIRRGTWGLVAACAWFVSLSVMGYTGSMQRETYYAALGSLGICLVFASCHCTKRAASWLVFGGTLLASWMMFGKHTGIIYAGLAVMTAMLLPQDPDRPLRWRLKWAGAGVAIAVISMLSFVAIVGSLRGFFFWYFRYPFGVYRFFEPARPIDMLLQPERERFFTPSLLALVAGLAGIASGLLPRRTLAFVLGPTLHCIATLVQRKGWGYQYLPIAGSTCLTYGAALVGVWTHPCPERTWTPLRATVAVGLLGLLGQSILQDAETSPWLKESQMRLHDHEVTAPREAANYLAAHTSATDRVYYYGNEPLVVFAAQRHPAAAPVIVLMVNYSFALDLKGEFATTAAERQQAERMQHEVQADTCGRILAERPGAMVFTDRATPGGNDGVGDVVGFCPELRPLLDHDYHVGRDADGMHVFLRNDHT